MTSEIRAAGKILNPETKANYFRQFGYLAPRESRDADGNHLSVGGLPEFSRRYDQ
jgi:hypothetical protein